MTSFLKRIFVILITLSFIENVVAQLSSTHYLPPVFSSQETATDGLRRQSIYLSTPSTTPIDVNIQSADGVTLNTTITISNISEGIFDLNLYYGDNDLSNNNTLIGVRKDKLNTVLNSEGLFFTSTTPFLVSYRVVSNSQGDILTTKGEFAKGTEFRLGALPLSVFNLNSTPNRNIFASFLAMEDDTDITVDGYDPDLLFKMSDGTYQKIPPPMVFSLDAREAYVFAADRNGNAVTGLNAGLINSLVGASITSNNPIVINSGNLTLSGSSANSSGSRDFGLDQSVPVEYLGNKYAFIKGNSTGGNINTLERPLIIATADNTDVYINGVLNTTLQSGEYLDVPGSHYSTDGTMLIETTNRVYAYQALSGNNAANGLGMNSIPPLNCYLQREVNFIPSIEKLHPDINMTPFINIITYTGSVITITENGGTPDVIATSNAKPIPGTTDWVAYSISGYSGNVKVESTGPTMISLFGQNNVIGAAGYFSGFGGNPQVEIITITGGIDDCYYHLSISELPENTTDYYWVRSSDNQIVSKDSIFTPTECGNYELHVFNGTCNDIVTTSVSCEPKDCNYETDGDGVWTGIDQDDDNDGILDNIECPNINAISNGNFDNNSDWTTSGGWNITGGEVVNNGTTENNALLEQNATNISDACFDQLLLSFDIRMISTPITSTDTSKLIIKLAGIPLIEINNPNGDSIAILKRLQNYIILNRTAFIINDPLDLSFTNIEMQIDWSGQPSTGKLTFDFSNNGDPVAIDNINLAVQDCSQDFDNDGIPNCQDSDSDNDGCLDALESDGNFTYNNIQNDTLTGGVDILGIPSIALGGQGIGTSQNSAARDTACSECHIDHPNYSDFDMDGVGNDCDLDDDNDGILDDDESNICFEGTSASDPFTSLGQAANVSTAGIYFFNLAGSAFSTYVDANGYVKIAIDFGNGSGNLPQVTSLNNSTRGILNPTVLATLIDLTEIKLTHSSGNLNITTSDATLLTRVVSNTTLHRGLIDNGINNSWVGTNANYVTANASCNTSSGGSLHQNIIHPCGNALTTHWIPSGSYQRLRWDFGEMPSSESFSLWVKGNIEACTISDIDTDGDTFPDRIDNDSDNDGCNDAREEDIYDPDNDGIAGIGTPSVDINGLVISITYSTPTNNFWQDASLISSVCQKCRAVRTNRHISRTIKY